jgi:peptide-methionine (R)-S-oxide reductase
MIMAIFNSISALAISACLAFCCCTDEVTNKNVATNPDALQISSITTTMSDTGKINKTKEEWAKSLTSEEYRVLREHGTERAFTGEFWDHHETGIYTCAGCGQELFGSQTKFDSGTGWPSYFAPIGPNQVEISRDASMGMVREEVHCSRCGGHLGHVFDDGPKPTGKRYCINSISLNFKK